MEEWRVHSKKADFNAISEKFLIDPVIARVIRNRDVISETEIDRYLNGTITDFRNLGNALMVSKGISNEYKRIKNILYRITHKAI